jgi:hypothetical protein
MRGVGYASLNLVLAALVAAENLVLKGMTQMAAKDNVNAALLDLTTATNEVTAAVQVLRGGMTEGETQMTADAIAAQTAAIRAAIAPKP